MILCLRTQDVFPCSSLPCDEMGQFSSFGLLSSPASNSPLKSEINPTTLNLRAKHWKISSGLVSMIFPKMQIHFFLKEEGQAKRQFACFVPQGLHKISMISFGFSASSSTPWMQLTFLFPHLLVSSLPIHIHTHMQTNSTGKCEFYCWVRWRVKTEETLIHWEAIWTITY